MRACVCMYVCTSTVTYVRAQACTAGRELLRGALPALLLRRVQVKMGVVLLRRLVLAVWCPLETHTTGLRAGRAICMSWCRTCWKQYVQILGAMQGLNLTLYCEMCSMKGQRRPGRFYLHVLPAATVSTAMARGGSSTTQSACGGGGS